MAVISRRGGAIHQLLVGDFEIVPKFSLANPLDFVYGHTLAPWPNRLEDGQYQFAGKNFQFEDLDAQGNKNHGLVLDELFEIRAQSDHSVLLGYRFGSDAGYPFEIDLEISYELRGSGLEVLATATNLGQDAPFAIGFHPYLLTTESFSLSANFQEQSIQDERLLPIGTKPIAGLQLDQDSPGLSELDHCFSGADEVVITRPDGEVVVKATANLPFFMLYRPNRHLSEAGAVIAIEPQSAMANVFRTSPDSCLLPAGQSRRFGFAIKKR